MNGNFTESIIEEAALTWFGELGYAVGHARTWHRANRRQSGKFSVATVADSI